MHNAIQPTQWILRSREFLVSGVRCDIAFVFSFGPAVRLHGYCSPQAGELIENLYAPLEWLHDHTFLERPIEWYTRVWQH